MPEKPSPAEFIAAMFANGPIKGGCDDCDAYQELGPSELNGDGNGVIHMITRHDDTCPFLRALEDKG